MAHKDETMPPADAGPVELVLGPWCRSETGDVLLCTNARCGWIGRCLVAEPLEAGDERDCQHGQLARACDRCADAREIAELREALTEIRDRIKAHPAYADLTEAEEIETGGDTAELSYLARVADAALGPNDRS